MGVGNTIRVDSVSVQVIGVSFVEDFFGSIVSRLMIGVLSLCLLLDSSNFDSLMHFGGINLFNISTGEDVVLVYGLLVENFGNGLEVRIDDVR